LRSWRCRAPRTDTRAQGGSREKYIAYFQPPDIATTSLTGPNIVQNPNIAESFFDFSPDPRGPWRKAALLRRWIGLRMAPPKHAAEIFTLPSCDLFGGRIRSLECRVVKGSKGDTAFCKYIFNTPPISSKRERVNLSAASITKLVQTEEENEAGFEARRADALLEFIKTKLCNKHALSRATTPGSLLGEDRSARPSDSLADDVIMTSPRTEQRAASRCDAEAHVHDPPRVSKSQQKQHFHPSEGSRGDPERPSTSPTIDCATSFYFLE
jgi:hypothetical protein